MKNRLGIIGSFGGKNLFPGGQALEGDLLKYELSSKGFENILCTDGEKHKNFKLIKEIYNCFKECGTVIVSLKGDVLKKVIPYVYWGKRLFKSKVYCICDGEILKDNPSYIKYLNFFDGTWAEFAQTAKEMEETGVLNCGVVPNFKRVNGRRAKPVVSDEGKRRICVVSTGILWADIKDAIDSVIKYNEKNKETVYLEIWGEIEKAHSRELSRMLSEYGDFIRYKGCEDFECCSEKITDSIAMLVPGSGRCDGFSNAVICAYGAGLPVISGNRPGAEEIIRAGETGWIYPGDMADSLYGSIEYAMTNTEDMLSMRRNCILLSTRYTPNYVVPRIIENYLK